MIAASTSQALSRNRMHPMQLGLLIGCGSILMMFTALTSAYIVRQEAGNWLEFPLPQLFYVSAGILLASSATLHLAFLAFKRADVGNSAARQYRVLLVLTALLGLAFVIVQYQAWQAMYAAGLQLSGNPAPAFVYVLSGTHAAHVLGGLVALVVALIHGFKLPVVPAPHRVVRLRLTLTYWHFMDLLWIYLLVFFALQR